MNSKFEVVVVVVVVVCAHGTVFFSWLFVSPLLICDHHKPKRLLLSLSVCTCNFCVVSCFSSVLFCCYCFLTTANKRFGVHMRLFFLLFSYLTEKCCHRPMTDTIHHAAANKPIIEWTYDSRLIDGAQEWFALPCPPLSARQTALYGSCV